jgi:2'-hydroxyisoflavone reductase
MVEQGTTGIFNATGPKSTLTVGGMLAGIQKVTKADARLTWVDAEFLAAQKVRGWSDMPVWLPPKGDTAGFSRINIKRALDQGLTFRSVPDTAQATLEWFRKQPADRQAKLKAGIKPEREVEVLAAWHAARK